MDLLLGSFRLRTDSGPQCDLLGLFDPDRDRADWAGAERGQAGPRALALFEMAASHPMARKQDVAVRLCRLAGDNVDRRAPQVRRDQPDRIIWPRIICVPAGRCGPAGRRLDGSRCCRATTGHRAGRTIPDARLQPLGAGGHPAPRLCAAHACAGDIQWADRRASRLARGRRGDPDRYEAPQPDPDTRRRCVDRSRMAAPAPDGRAPDLLRAPGQPGEPTAGR